MQGRNGQRLPREQASGHKRVTEGHGSGAQQEWQDCPLCARNTVACCHPQLLAGKWPSRISQCFHENQKSRTLCEILF